VAEVVECLPSKHEALSSNPILKRGGGKRKKKEVRKGEEGREGRNKERREEGSEGKKQLLSINAQTCCLLVGSIFCVYLVSLEICLPHTGYIRPLPGSVSICFSQQAS
jgi:hypothetical protein